MASYKVKQSELDNGIFELIRLELVARGYLPDFVAAGSAAAYEAQKQAIRNSGKQVIECFNVGSWKSRGEKNSNNIVLDRGTPAPARTGVGKSLDYDLKQDESGYEKSLPADVKWDISYRLSYFTQLAGYADIIEDVLRVCLGARKLVSTLDDNGVKTGEVWLFYQSEFDTSGADFIERGVNYIARNVDLIGAKELGDIAKFNADEFGLDERMLRQDNNENVNIPTGEISLTGDEV